MDMIILLDKGKQFESLYAAPSLLTGRFGACIVNSDMQTVIDAFSNPGRMLVHNIDDLYPDQEYDQYKSIYMLEDTERGIKIILTKGNNAE